MKTGFKVEMEDVMKYLLEEQLFFNLDGICKRTGYKNPVWKFSGKMQSCTRCH